MTGAHGPGDARVVQVPEGVASLPLGFGEAGEQGVSVEVAFQCCVLPRHLVERGDFIAAREVREPLERGGQQPFVGFDLGAKARQGVGSRSWVLAPSPWIPFGEPAPGCDGPS